MLLVCCNFRHNAKVYSPDTLARLVLDLLDGIEDLQYEFLRDYKAQYTSDQLLDYDAVISLKLRVTAESLRDVSRLCAIGLTCSLKSAHNRV